MKSNDLSKNSNRRKSERLSTKNLWAIERRGDYQFFVQVKNISLGGAFLQKRVLSKDNPSELTFFKRGKKLQVQAIALHDILSEKNFGCGYSFVDVSKEKSDEIKNFLKQF